MSNLQLFTEPGGDGGGSEGGDGAGAGGNPGNNNNTTMSFDEFLALEGNQSEFDRRVQKAVNTAVTNAQTKWKTLTDDKVSEAEKLAQMTSEEKANYRAKKAEDALEEMKRQNARSDMAKEARKMLADENITIPDELVMNLVAEDADGTKAAAEAFATMYKEAVQNAVKDALKGKAPKAGNGGDKPPMTKQQILEVKNPSERQKLIAENITLFQ